MMDRIESNFDIKMDITTKFNYNYSQTMTLRLRMSHTLGPFVYQDPSPLHSVKIHHHIIRSFYLTGCSNEIFI